MERPTGTRRPGRTKPIRVIVDGGGTFTVDATGIETGRPDVFHSNHFSVFDLIVRLDRDVGIGLKFHFDEWMRTHVIDAIDGETG